MIGAGGSTSTSDGAQGSGGYAGNEGVGGMGEATAGSGGAFANSIPVGEFLDAGCDTGPLMRKIADGAQGATIPGGCVATPYGTDGAVVLDAIGKVTAISGTYYTNVAATRATVDSLSAERWPCLANQTVLYTCANPYLGP
jgi:hypothetical protein